VPSAYLGSRLINTKRFLKASELDWLGLTRKGLVLPHLQENSGKPQFMNLETGKYKIVCDICAFQLRIIRTENIRPAKPLSVLLSPEYFCKN
jgi:hypothetical protein